MSENNIFHYRKPAQYNVFPGAHSGKVIGNGLVFNQHKPLIAFPDPRHLDLRASFLNPFSHYQVRVFRQLSRLDVFLLADLSASMSFTGKYSKKQIIVDCLFSAAESAHATGDRFGFVGCGQTLDPQLLISPASQQYGRVVDIATRIKSSRLTGRADGLLQAANYLPDRSALVFLLSDFYLPMAMVRQIMRRLNQHMVVPLVIWDKQESSDLPAWGLLKFSDLELGKTRTLLMRPSLREKIYASYLNRKQQLRKCFRSFGAEPLFIEQGFQAELISQYFFQYATS